MRLRQYKNYVYLLIVITIVGHIVWILDPFQYGYPLNICQVAIGITTTEKYQHRVQLQEATWLQQMCKTNHNYRFITDEKNSTNIKAVYSTCPKDYNSVCCKTAELIHKMYELFPTQKWFVKCDDDSYVVPDRLISYLSRFNSKEPVLTGCTLNFFNFFLELIIRTIILTWKTL